MSAASNANLKLAKAAADKLGLVGKERHAFLANYISPQPSNPHKRARIAAHREAERIGLWKKGEALAFGKWRRRLFARLSKRFKAKWLDRVGLWYKRNLKSFSKQAYAYAHDDEAQAFARKQARAARKRAAERRKSRVVISEDVDRPLMKGATS